MTTKQEKAAQVSHDLAELTEHSRQLAVEQVQQLQVQARHWQAQAKHLGKALRHESKQRRRLSKMIKHLQMAGIDWSQEMLKRGENVAEDWVSQGSKLSQDWLERGSTLGQDLVKRGGALSQEWIKRGSEVTHDLVERGETLLQPKQQRKNTFWTVFGFSLGMVAAAIFTYVFVRNRLARPLPAEEEHIELPPREVEWSFAHQSKPAGEIYYSDSDGTTIATLQAVGVQRQQIAAPANAAFVGVVTSKTYYPLDEQPSDAKDVLYFSSEEEAQTEGFTAAQ